MKLITAIQAALALACLLAVTLHAQQAPYTLSFRLTVEGQPCPNATYWAFLGAPNTDHLNYGRLTDADGDGVYTGTGTGFANSRFVAQIMQGTGTATVYALGSGAPLGERPGAPSTVIRD